MTKNTDNRAIKRKSSLASGNSEELRFIVPNVVADRFRQVAKASRMSTAELFEEMVEAHAHGMDLDK